MSLLEDQFKAARKNIKEMKKTIPYIFPEYSRLKTAELRLKESQEELKSAQKAWQKL